MARAETVDEIAVDEVATMAAELSARPDAFGIGARMSWDGVDEIPESIREENEDLYRSRLYPCCALVKNTRIFRIVRFLSFLMSPSMLRSTIHNHNAGGLASASRRQSALLSSCRL